MKKRPVSFTLDAANLLWLKGQAAARNGNVSAVVDELVSEARLAGRTRPGTARSVVGTIDLPDDDADLRVADGYVRTIFDRSLRRPMLVKGRPPRDSASKRRG